MMDGINLNYYIALHLTKLSQSIFLLLFTSLFYLTLPFTYFFLPYNSYDL